MAWNLPAQVLVAMLWLFLSSWGTAEIQSNPPNIIMVLADDLGWGDLSCHGHPDYKTPNIDRLASQGVDLQQFSVAAPLCSPSRTAILTGTFPARFGILYPFQMNVNIAIGQPDWLSHKGPTLPSLLRDHGYATAICGKWHLVEEQVGDMLDAPTPADYGFTHWKLMRGPWKPAIQPTGSFDAALDFIKNRPKGPFFLQVTTHEPHCPYIPSQEALKANAHLSERIQKYAASVTDLDRGVGRLLDLLEQEKLDQNTLVIFTSDNGPAKPKTNPEAPYQEYYNAGSSGGLRGHKGDLYEGGPRVPFIVRWPGHSPSGKIDKVSVVNAVDLLPTLVGIAGVAMPKEWGGDGEDRSSVLKGIPSGRSKTLFWRTEKSEALRDGDWKMVLNRKTGNAELFNLNKDPFEQQNLAKTSPEKTTRYLEELERWRKTLPTELDPTVCSVARKKQAKSSDK